MKVVPRRRPARKRKGPYGRAKQYRTRWRRSGWGPGTSNKSRTFAHRRDALAFWRRLNDGRRPDLQPLAFAVLEVREIHAGPWRVEREGALRAPEAR